MIKWYILVSKKRSDKYKYKILLFVNILKSESGFNWLKIYCILNIYI